MGPGGDSRHLPQRLARLGLSNRAPGSRWDMKLGSWGFTPPRDFRGENPPSPSSSASWSPSTPQTPGTREPSWPPRVQGDCSLCLLPA